MTASAPGKVLLAGEYAVLDGAPALVMAVERRAVATVMPGSQPLSPFLQAARLEVAATAGGGAAARLGRVRVDSAALAMGTRKLGLGSSAAATVAAIAVATGDTGARLHGIAHRAHARAQGARGARGSGADVAASVHGGLLEVRRDVEGEPLLVRRLVWPAGLEIALVWTGTPADTATLVSGVRALRERDPAGHAAAVAAIAAVAAQLIAAVDAGDVPACLTAVAAGAAALPALGVVPPAFPPIARLAQAHGGAAKPTGAGGGDLVLCAFAGDAGPFRVAARAAGMTLIDAPLARHGVLLQKRP